MPLINFVIIAFVLLGLAFTACLFWTQRYNRWLLRQKGQSIQATITEVRDDRSEMQTIITYKFTVPNTGRVYSRSGVLQRHLPIPREGEKIEVVYLPHKPGISRLRNEEGSDVK